MTTTGLFWSKKGEVACANHAPDPDGPRWTAEGWRGIRPEELTRFRYRCQHCAGSVRVKSAEKSSLDSVA
jgi:hypothetical protein